MPNLLQSFLDSDNDGQIDVLSRRFGISPQQTGNIAQMLLPMLAQGFGSSMQQGGITSLFNLVQNSPRPHYEATPEQLKSPEAINDGNSILSKLFGNKDVSRNVARQAANKSGVDYGIVKQMLPLLALAAISHLKKRAGAAQANTAQPNLMGQLSQFLGSNGNMQSPLGNLMELLQQRKSETA